jgi:probable HAF family extracellular repeat protein
MTWTLTNLGTFGGDRSEAVGINEAGEVVGNARTAAGEAHGFSWDGSLNGLGALGADGHSAAMDIGPDGIAVGWSWADGTTTRHAVVWDQGITDLFTTTAGYANAINGDGQIVGQWGTHAFLWDGQQAADLGTLGGGESRANDINASGTVVGWSKIAGDAADRGFVYASGTMTDLGTLGGAGSRAWGVNDDGVITGDSQLAGATDWSGAHGFIYESGTMTDIGTLGGARSHAHAINNEGAVVGEAQLADNTTWHAFIYLDGEMTDLNDRLAAGASDWTITAARDINSARQIVGVATNSAGDVRAVLLTPQ